MDDVLTQIWLLVNCLKKKIEALDVICELTNLQQKVIVNSPTDNISFNKLVDKKQEYIIYVDDLDSIFANIFEKIKDFMGKGNIEHRDAMLELQGKIVEVTELTVKIKTLEEKNARTITGGVRKPPKKLVQANKAALAYKKNKKF